MISRTSTDAAIAVVDSFIVRRAGSWSRFKGEAHIWRSEARTVHRPRTDLGSVTISLHNDNPGCGCVAAGVGQVYVGQVYVKQLGPQFDWQQMGNRAYVTRLIKT